MKSSKRNVFTRKLIFSSLLPFFTLTSCNKIGFNDGDTTSTQFINGESCTVYGGNIIKEAALTCRNGWQISYLPNRWGNEQLPVQFVAVACDFRYPIVYNNSGVVCIFTNAKLRKDTERAGKNYDDEIKKFRAEQATQVKKSQ